MMLLLLMSEVITFCLVHNVHKEGGALNVDLLSDSCVIFQYTAEVTFMNEYIQTLM